MDSKLQVLRLRHRKTITSISQYWLIFLTFCPILYSKSEGRKFWLGKNDFGQSSSLKLSRKRRFFSSEEKKSWHGITSRRETREIEIRRRKRNAVSTFQVHNETNGNGTKLTEKYFTFIIFYDSCSKRSIENILHLVVVAFLLEGFNVINFPRSGNLQLLPLSSKLDMRYKKYSGNFLNVFWL